MVDAPVSGTDAFGHEGSSPSLRTLEGEPGGAGHSLLASWGPGRPGDRYLRLLPGKINQAGPETALRVRVSYIPRSHGETDITRGYEPLSPGSIPGDCTQEPSPEAPSVNIGVEGDW